MELTTTDGHRLVLAQAPPRLGGEAAVYEAVGPDGPCMVKVAHAPDVHGAWLDAERGLLEDLGRDPATAGLVPKVLGHGRWADRPFVALERFPATLADLVDARPSPEARLALAARVADAWARLHRARPLLVHRDLKPSNLLVDGDRVVVTDFGTARERPAGHTTTVALLTPGYAPPEQALPHGRPEPSWDTFALAATLFHLLVGEPAYAPSTHGWRLTPRGRALLAGQEPGGGSPWDYLDLDGAEPLTPGDRARLRAAVRGPLPRVLERALAPDPRRRAGTPEDLCAALLRSRPAARPWRPGALAAVALVLLGARPAPPPPRYEVVRIDAGVAPGLDGPIPVAPFELGDEVDQALWEELTGIPFTTRRRMVDGVLELPCTSFQGYGLVGAHLPVVCVDFLDAVRFADALSVRQGLEPAHRVTAEPDGSWRVELVPGADGWRLPTVAEWRLAIGATGPERPPGAPRENTAGEEYVAAFPEIGAWDEGDDGYVVAAPVGSFPPGPNGVHDGFGNVAEWLWDRTGDGERAVGAGSWGAAGKATAYGAIGDVAETTRNWTMGFRLARTPGGVSQGL